MKQILMLTLLALSACTQSVQMRPLFPPAADIADASAAKPIAPASIVTSEADADAYDIELELWGERVSRAGQRICRWAVDNGAKLSFSCPPAPRD